MPLLQKKVADKSNFHENFGFSESVNKIFFICLATNDVCLVLKKLMLQFNHSASDFSKQLTCFNTPLIMSYNRYIFAVRGLVLFRVSSQVRHLRLNSGYSKVKRSL